MLLSIATNARLFTQDGFLKITKVVHILGILFPQLRLCINFDEKGAAGLPTFCAIVEQVHLVTLIENNYALFDIAFH
jgi:hypothetical protein